MADYKAMLEEEFEVLESIYPDELEKISETSVRIRVEPDEGSPSHPLSLNMVLTYPPTYPDVAPEITFETIEEEDEDDDDEEGGGNGELTEEEEETVLAQLHTIVEESLGMAMSFTLVASCREALSGVVSSRLIREQEAEDAKTKAYEEAEAARTRGTPLTPQAFLEWRQRFTLELKQKRDREEEERIKALPPREREDVKKRRERLSGRQLFETTKIIDDEKYYEDDSTSIDLSKYTREERDKERRMEEEEEDRRREGLLADEGD